MLKIIVIVAGLLLAGVIGLVAYASTQPDTFRVERSITINAPAEKIYPRITHFKGWREWSPYENKDPAMKRRFDGPESGQGAVYGWEGDKNVGEGRMEIVEAKAPSAVKIDLWFLKPMEARSVADFTLAPEGSGTKVTWAMTGRSNLVQKVVCVFMNMDTMVGADFEVGLRNLKKLAETA